MKLQHQRGSHSSAFFKGTHQCAHKVNIFDNTSFDSDFVDFKMFDQPIPSPWGMPVMEFFDFNDQSTYFLEGNISRLTLLMTSLGFEWNRSLLGKMLAAVFSSSKMHSFQALPILISLISVQSLTTKIR